MDDGNDEGISKEATTAPSAVTAKQPSTIFNDDGNNRVDVITYMSVEDEGGGSSGGGSTCIHCSCQNENVFIVCGIAIHGLVVSVACCQQC